MIMMVDMKSGQNIYTYIYIYIYICMCVCVCVCVCVCYGFYSLYFNK